MTHKKLEDHTEEEQKLFAAVYGWAEEIEKVGKDGKVSKVPNPVSALEAGNAQVERFIKETLKAQAVNEAVEKARRDVLAKFE